MNWDELPPEAQLGIGAGVLAMIVMTIWSLLSSKGKGFIWLVVVIIIVLAASGVGVTFTRN